MGMSILPLRSTTAAGAPADDAGTGRTTSREELAEQLLAGLRRNSSLNLWVRGGLGVFGLVAAAAALAYALRRGGEIHTAVAGSDQMADVLALCLPFVLCVLLSILAGIAAYMSHARGIEETWRTLEALNRIEREGEVAVSARGLIFAFEEKLQNARRAFTLQLWLGRSMFLVCVGLLLVTVVNAIGPGPAELTAATGAGSFATALLGISKRVPQNIGAHLADVVQIQSIITGCDRQISLLESTALTVLKDGPHDAEGRAFALHAQSRIDRVVEHAVQRIEHFADPGLARARAAGKSPD